MLNNSMGSFILEKGDKRLATSVSNFNFEQVNAGWGT